MKKYFILGYFFGCFLFFLTSEQNLNLAKVEKFDLRLLKNEIVALNLSANKNIFANTYESSIYDVAEVAVKKEKSIPISIDIKTKTKQGKNSIFVEAFQVIRTFPTRPNLNYYDPVENQFVKQSVMLKAHLTCIKQVQNLPREIDKKDKKVKFDKKYSGLFKKNQNYEKVFGYNLYLEENLGKDSSKNKIKQAAKKLEHAVCFAINPADYDFSQDQAKEINVKGGIVAYVRKGKTLPNLDLIRAYQNAIKNFCEDRTQSDRNNKSTLRGDPSITFFNEKSRQAVIFNRETKVFITAYKISDDQRDRYIESGEIGQ